MSREKEKEMSRNEVRYDVKRVMAAPESRKIRKFLEQGWVIVSQKNRLLAPSTFVLRREKEWGRRG